MRETKAETAVSSVQKVARIEDCLGKEVTENIGPDVLWVDHFIPYIQLGT